MSPRSVRSVRVDSSSRRLTSAQLEEQLVRRRQAEFERLTFWTDSSTYFRAWDFNNSHFSNWTSNEFYKNRAESSQKAEEAKRKGERLVERRGRLKKLLQEEESALQHEIESLAKKKEEMSLEMLKTANLEILFKEEEKRRRERDLKMYHHWRESQPVLREFEAKQRYDFVKKSWMHQVAEKRREREAEERRQAESAESERKLLEEQRRVEKEREEERRKAEEELRQFLRKQVELIKCKEEQDRILKKEATSILREQAELDAMLDERKRVEEKRKQRDLSLFHRRQYQILLKRRAKEVRENLEADRKFLEKLSREEETAAKAKTERAERLKREMDLARSVFRKQAELEDAKAKHFEFLFEEEAKRMLEEQESRWKREEEARSKLVDDVLKTIKLQIQEKLLENAREQEEMRRSREELTRELEEGNRELKEHEERARAARESLKKDLDQQILEKRLRIQQQKKKNEEDKENELRARRQEEEMLLRELSEMKASGYQPKATGRKSLFPL